MNWEFHCPHEWTVGWSHQTTYEKHANVFSHFVFVFSCNVVEKRTSGVEYKERESLSLSLYSLTFVPEMTQQKLNADDNTRNELRRYSCAMMRPGCCDNKYSFYCRCLVEVDQNKVVAVSRVIVTY